MGLFNRKKPQINDDLSVADKAPLFIEALGGVDNITKIDSCITRLRATLKDVKKINEATLKALGSKGNVKVGEDKLQVILGVVAKEIADLIAPKLNK